MSPFLGASGAAPLGAEAQGVLRHQGEAADGCRPSCISLRIQLAASVLVTPFKGSVGGFEATSESLLFCSFRLLLDAYSADI